MINTPGYVQHPFPVEGRFEGEVAFDYAAGSFIVWLGSHWALVDQSEEWEDKLTPDELVDVRNYIKNKERYDQLLRDHFPEDML